MSIRTRLTLWYTGVVALSLLFSGISVYYVVTGVLTNLLDDRLMAQAQEVVRRIQAENDPVAIATSGRVQLPSIDVFGSQYFTQISQLDGRAVQLSENLRGQRLPVPDSALDDVPLGRARFVTTTTPQGVRLRVLNAHIVLGGRPIGIIQIANSLSTVDDALQGVRRALLVGSILALALAALGGGFLARTALRPIKSITEIAQRITSTDDLDQRIPVEVPGDELGQLTETINDMLGRLDDGFQAQQRLVADVSHELRTPLTTIQGNLDLLRRGAVDDPQMRTDALRAIGNETARMRRLVNDLLLLAQADSGLTLHLQPVEVDTLLLEVYRQAQIMAQGRGVAIRLGAEDQAVVLGDADRLRQLLLNLVDNGIKYTPGGGSVTLKLLRNDGWVQVAVEDTGVGISSDDLPLVFDRFYRADRSRTGAGGSGLGLAIARWIAEAHNGRLEVDSVPNAGSEFTLWLPEARNETEANHGTKGDT
jgi:heavy metal sensor kinase